MRGVALCFAAFLLAAPAASSVALAAEEEQQQPSTYVAPLADPALEARAKALQRELRCLVCQGQSIDESNADLATDLRRLIRQQLQAGQSEDDIKNFLVARYGVFILMKPPVQQDTFFLWFGPALLVLAGAGAIGVIVLRARRRLSTAQESDLEMQTPDTI